MKLSHSKLILISGLAWLAIGIYLLQLGLRLLLGADSHQPMVDTIAYYLGTREIAVLCLIVIGLYVGYFKGRYVLAKSARRGVSRIAALPNPSHIKLIYSKQYYFLLGGMVLLGISIKFLGLNTDVRGLVDVIIGSALINGAVTYFRS